MTDKPEATKVESTAHYKATKLDVLAAAMYANMPQDFEQTTTDRAHDLDACYVSAAEILAELDRLNSANGETK